MRSTLITIAAFLLMLSACSEDAPEENPSAEASHSAEIERIPFGIYVNDRLLAINENEYICLIAELKVEVRDADGSIVGAIDLTEDAIASGGEYGGHPAASGTITTADPYTCTVRDRVEVTKVSDFYEVTATALHPILDEEVTTTVTVSFEDATGVGADIDLG